MRTLIAVALLLTGCATSETSPKHWRDFRTARIEITTGQVMNGPNKDAPREVIIAFAECATDYLLKYTSQEDLAALDAWAQQKRSFSKAENDAYEARAHAAGAVTIGYDTFDALNNTCPSDVPSFKQYFKP